MDRSKRDCFPFKGVKVQIEVKGTRPWPWPRQQSSEGHCVLCIVGWNRDSMFIRDTNNPVSSRVAKFWSKRIRVQFGVTMKSSAFRWLNELFGQGAEQTWLRLPQFHQHNVCNNAFTSALIGPGPLSTPLFSAECRPFSGPTLNCMASINPQWQ